MLQDCQFCSVISKANGEDPIGTAGTHDHWIVTELPQPWSMAQWRQDPSIAPTLALFEHLIVKQGMRLRPIAIAPDRLYSQPGHRRLLYYYRPAHRFSQYEKQEYLIPTSQMHDLIAALLHEPDRLDQYVPYRQPRPTRDILVCTHGNVDVACSRFGNPIYKALRSQYVEPGPPAETQQNVTISPSPPSPASGAAQAPLSSLPLRVWRCSHFGGHRFAPTLIDLPTGQYFGHIESSHLDALVHHRGEVSQLQPCYRGWAGLGSFEQIAERDVWMELGWEWLGYAKEGRILAQEKSESPTWASVQIEFDRPDGANGAYKVDIELAGEVKTAAKSGTDMKPQMVKQYRSRLMLA